ncbi:MAG: GNAT family N-acetyltransferase [Magnetospirillum sp.]|nr:GNAT family N-acetyltransferase [Magnetospirillum sp.]
MSEFSQMAAERFAASSPHPFILCAMSGRAFTYGEWDAYTGRLAANLTGAGIAAGDRILVSIADKLDFLSVYFATLRVGIVPVIANPSLSAPELQVLFDEVGCKAVLSAGTVASGAIGGTGNVIDFRLLHADVEPLGLVTQPADAPAYIIFSSGTSGRPKACGISRRNMIRELAALRDGHALPDDCAHYCVLPVIHASGLFRNVLLPFFQGGRTVLAPKFDAETLWQEMERHRTDFVQLVPMMIARLIEVGTPLPESLRARLHYVGSASAPLPRSTKARFRETFGVPIAEGYGLSETTCGVILGNPHAENYDEQAIGRPLPGVTLRVLDEDGKDVAPGSSGHIALKGEMIMVGYLNNVVAATPIFDGDGWFLTNDVGHVDHKGNLFIEGRRSEIIHRAGFKIAPMEIEEALLACEGVTNAIAFGIQRESVGEDIIAMVDCAPGFSFDARKIQVEIEGRLARYKQPSLIIRRDLGAAAADIKISRGKIKDQYLAEIGRKRKSGNARKELENRPRAFLWDDVVYLRPIMDADIHSEVYIDNIQSPETQYFTHSGRFPMSEMEITDFWAGVRKPGHLALAVCLRKDDRYVGNIALRFDWVARTAEFGRLIFKEYHHDDYSYRALSLVLGYAFDTMKVKKVWGGGSNPSSIPSLIRMGFAIEGRLRKHHFLNGIWRDQFMVGLLDDEYCRIKQGLPPRDEGGSTGDESVAKVAREVVANAFAISAADLSLESSPATVARWDSLGVLRLWHCLEDALGQELPSSEILCLASVRDVMELIGRRRST